MHSTFLRRLPVRQRAVLRTVVAFFLFLVFPPAGFLPLSSGAAAPIASVEPGPDYANDRLVGTMRAGSFSGAVFEDSSGKQTFYRTKTTFSDGTRILSVKRRRILVETPDGGRVEYVVKGGKPGKPPVRSRTARPPRSPRSATMRR